MIFWWAEITGSLRCIRQGPLDVSAPLGSGLPHRGVPFLSGLACSRVGRRSMECLCKCAQWQDQAMPSVSRCVKHRVVP